MPYRSRNDREQKSRRTLGGRLFSLLLFIAAMVAMASLSLALVAPYFASTHGWIFPLFGLIAPAIYISSFTLMLLLIVRWQWRVALPLLALLIMGVGRISLFVKVPVNKDYGQVSYKGCVKVMSYNVRGLLNDKWRASTDQIAEFIEQERADIICLQEYNGSTKGSRGTLQSQLKRYNVASYGSNAIYSRYPIIAKGDIFADDADGLEGRSIYADLLIGKDTIRVINNHLNSNSITGEDKAYLKATTVIRDTLRNERLGHILRNFANGAAIRTAQAKVIREKMDETQYKYIVCGDFNDAPMSFTYFEIARDMSDAFKECGDGYSYTYRGFNNLLRIDYILCSAGITPMSYSVDREMVASDHLPVTAQIKINR